MLLGLAAAVGLHRLSTTEAPFHTTLRIDALLFPAALAVLLRRPALRQWAAYWLRLWPLVALLLFVLITWEALPHLTDLAVVWLTPALLLGTMLRPHT
jgi:hypothetical protein